LGATYLLEGQGFCFYYMFKRNLSGYHKIWGARENLGGTAPECFLVSTGLSKVKSKELFEGDATISC